MTVIALADLSQGWWFSASCLQELFVEGRTSAREYLPQNYPAAFSKTRSVFERPFSRCSRAKKESGSEVLPINSTQHRLRLPVIRPRSANPMQRIFTNLGVHIRVRLPRRFSELAVFDARLD